MGMERNKDDLLRGVLEPESASGAASGAASGEPADSRALMVLGESRPPVAVTLAVLLPLIPEKTGDILDEFFRFALLGVSVGFSERNLSHRDEAHLSIVRPLLADIRSVYERLCELGTGFDQEEFRLRAYDYGIHKAYYLDWQLYLSKELY